MKKKSSRKPQPSAGVPDNAAIAGICADLIAGLGLRDACRANGVTLATMRRGLASKSAAWATVRALVLAAQVEVQRRAAAQIAAAADKGAPAALAIVAARLTASHDTLEEPPTDPVEWMRWRLRDVQRRIATADGIAYNQLLRQESELREQIRSATTDSGSGRTPAEVMAKETAHARELSEVHLQVYAVEWLRRHPGVHLATVDGRIEIVA